MPTYATPGVYFETADQDNQVVPSIRTDVAAFVGIAQKGPVQQPRAVQSWKQFQSVFGEFIPSGYLAYVANAFFQNGGQRMYAIRVAAPAVSTTLLAAAVQPADGLTSLILSAQGFAAGALVTIRQAAAATAVGSQPADRLSSVVNTINGFPQGALVHITQTGPPFVGDWHRVQAVDAAANTLYWESPLLGTFNLANPITFEADRQEDRLLKSVNLAMNTLTWTDSLVPAFNVNQPMQFDSGAAEAQGTLYDVAGNPTLLVQAANAGTWGDGVVVEVSQSSLAATQTSSQPQPASGASSFVQSVAGFLKFSLVKFYQSNPAISGYRLVSDVDPIAKTLMWDKPLPAALNLAQPIFFETLEFSLAVFLKGRLMEIFPGLSLVGDHIRYVDSVINGPPTSKYPATAAGLPSQYIRVDDLKSITPYPDNLPDVQSPQLVQGRLQLRGGRDGIAALQPMDFTGDPAAGEKRGLRALEDVEEISIVAVPDILIEPVSPALYAPAVPPRLDPCLPCPAPTASAFPFSPPPSESAPRFSLSDIFQVQQALVEHCEAMQFRFAVVDPPDFSGAKQHVDFAEIQTWRRGFDTEFAALYFPWILVRDPLQLGGQVVRRIPPSGHVAGVYANTDLTEGVFKAPANAILQWAQDMTTEVSVDMQGILNPIGVNCLRAFPGRGLRVYGARTMSSDTSWRFVNVRRLMCMIEHALVLSLQWAAFEPNNIYLWHSVTVSISGFLETIWKQGGLAGNTAEESFYVKCDATNNPMAITEDGQLIIEVGVAPISPAEFVVFRIGRTHDTLEISE
ncbi:MAG: hypothetical protein C5B50_17420 [Verrucomicrobia bacterium]|nr:MAG: hypothetical protein C5B50_17420 [Verrucomicrobiota bacterium]